MRKQISYYMYICTSFLHDDIEEKNKNLDTKYWAEFPKIATTHVFKLSYLQVACL